MSRDLRELDFGDYTEAGGDLLMFVLLSPVWILCALIVGLLFGLGWIALNAERLFTRRTE